MGGSLGLWLAWGLWAQTTACELHRVESLERAALVVYFTRFENEDDTEGRYRQCQVVSASTERSIPFFVTVFRQDANTIVHPKNWP